MCDDIADLTEQIHDLESMFILETSLTHMVGHLDVQTRDSLFKAVNLIVNAKQAANQRCLVTPAMIKRINEDSDNIQVGLVAKSVIDLLVDTANTQHIDQMSRNLIFKSVVMRLALELNHDTLDSVVYELLPAMKSQKERASNRYMYG